MSDRLTAAQIEDQVKLLDPEQLKLFTEWFEEFKSDLWDEQIENDYQAGRLDHLRERAMESRRKGECTPL